MNEHEPQRVIVLTQVVGGAMTVAEAAVQMQVSTRQVQRLVAEFRQKGVVAVVHGNRGRAPAHTVAEQTRQRVRLLATEKYAGFNQQHLTEQLAEEEGIALSRSSVRRILAAEGITSPRTRRPPVTRQRRERWAQAGALVQIDASPHDWLEGRGPRLTLFAAIDDATGAVLAARFRVVEDAHGYFLLVQEIVTTHGRPLAFYHDRHSIFRAPTRQETVTQQLTGQREQTPFGRLLDALGSAAISAHSPQAKGRVERLFGTLQDRLVSALRLAGATTMAQANAGLTPFLVDFNARFCVPAADHTPCFRPLEPTTDPEACFCFTYQRTVGMDNTVRLGAHRLQRRPTRVRQSWARAEVEVREHLDGRVSVHHAGQCLVITPAPPEAPVVRARGGRRAPALPGGVAAPVTPSPARSQVQALPGRDHPWRQGYQQRRDKVTEPLG